MNYSNHRTWSDFPILVPFITIVWHITDTFEPPQLQNQPPTAQKEPFHKGPDKISFSLRSSLTATSLLEGLTTSKVLPSLAGRRLLLRNIPDRISLIASFSGDILLEEEEVRKEQTPTVRLQMQQGHGQNHNFIRRLKATLGKRKYAF